MVKENTEERVFEKPLNCWQVKQCGREPGGTKADQLGVCPASTDKRLDGVHGGINAGRACWVIAGSFNAGNEGTFAKERRNCAACDFYNAVKREEGTYMWPVMLLLKLLGKKNIGRKSSL